ncbi:MAG: M23 family metallopeptidase [Alphaproteobacteria bacterium]|nr:M23 family metallopeptidase [Alphaproteobacteria bacterium]
MKSPPPMVPKALSRPLFWVRPIGLVIALSLPLQACVNNSVPAPVVDGLAANRGTANRAAASGGSRSKKNAAAPNPAATEGNSLTAPVGRAAAVETTALPPPPGAKAAKADTSASTAKPTNLGQPQSLTPEPATATATATATASATTMTAAEPDAAPSAINDRLPALANSAGVGTAPAMIWPVQGQLLSGYGRQDGGSFNDGVNLAAAAGSVVKAAADGTVTFAGRDEAFGNLMLVEHANGWTTAYAHLEAMYAKSGDTVKQGAMIGRVGATGKANKQPQLHFELRQGKQPVDPMLLMPKLAAS